MTQIIARRLGRLAFGAVLLVGFGLLMRDVLPDHVGRPDWLLGWSMAPRHHRGVELVWLISLTWMAAFAAGVIARWIAMRGRLVRYARAARPEALFAASLIVPMLGLALVLPITLHMPIALALGGTEGFADWVSASAWITGPAHLVLAALCARRGYQLAKGRPAISPLRVYLCTVVTSCLPFAILMMIPPILVAITGLVFVPLLRQQERIAGREHVELAAIPRLAGAIALPPRGRAVPGAA